MGVLLSKEKERECRERGKNERENAATGKIPA